MNLLTHTVNGTARTIIPSKWKRRVKIFVILNVVGFIFLPKLFFGVYETAGCMIGGIAESRRQYHIRKKYGATILELYQTKRVYGDWFKSMKNWEFIK